MTNPIQYAQPDRPDIPTLTGYSDIEGEISRSISIAAALAGQLWVSLGGLRKSIIRIDGVNLEGNDSITPISVGNIPAMPVSPGIDDIILPDVPADPSGFIVAEYKGDPLDYPPDTVFMNVPDEVISESSINDYVSGLLNTIQAYLLDQVTNPGTGLPAGVETGIFYRELFRSIQVKDYIDTQVRAQWSRRGFSIPADILNAMDLNTDVFYLNKRKSINREILVKKEEVKQENVNQTLEDSAHLESQLSAYHTDFQELLQALSSAMQKMKIDIYKSWETLYKYYQEALKIYYEIVANRVKIDIEINKNILTKYLADIEFYKAQSEYAISQVIVALKSFEINVLKYKGQMAKYLADGKYEIQKMNAEVDYKVGMAKVNTSAAESEIQINIHQARYLSRAAINAGEAAAQQAVGLLAGKHIRKSLSTSYSGSATSGRMLTHDHNFKEK